MEKKEEAKEGGQNGGGRREKRNGKREGTMIGDEDDEEGGTYSPEQTKNWGIRSRMEVAIKIHERKRERGKGRM